MKIIFSRKGIDSSFGNYASPIMPSGQLCWLPIPEDNKNKLGLPTYRDIRFEDTNLGTIIEDLSSRRITADKTVHLDPDIFKKHRDRKPNWRPVFGQTSAAESHLRNKGVSVGDVFLFFGWFKQCENVNGKLKYKKSAPDLHVLYGWLQIAEIIKIYEYYASPDLFGSGNLRSIPDWLSEHPHLIGENYGKSDTLYFSADKLTINGTTTKYPGAGIFNSINDKIILTAGGHTRSIWQLPDWMYPSENKLPLSYNEERDKWLQKDGVTHLRIASRGQEFVLDTSFYPEAYEWLYDLIQNGDLRYGNS
jgi:hypothetical protein